MKNKFQWKNKPNKTMVQDDLIEMVAPKDTNLFNSPNGTFSCENFPFLYDEIEGDFSVKCQVSPEFVSLYDLGSIVVWENDDRWIKFAYENSDVGLSAQCPAGEQCKVTFWNFEISNTVPENIRNVNK